MLEHELLFQFKNGGVTRPYELAGFADKRTGGTNSAWEELKKAAQLLAEVAGATRGLPNRTQEKIWD